MGIGALVRAFYDTRRLLWSSAAALGSRYDEECTVLSSRSLAVRDDAETTHYDWN